MSTMKIKNIRLTKTLHGIPSALLEGEAEVVQGGIIWKNKFIPMQYLVIGDVCEDSKDAKTAVKKAPAKRTPKRTPSK